LIVGLDMMSVFPCYVFIGREQATGNYLSSGIS
jgi:hypothetical protein